MIQGFTRFWFTRLATFCCAMLLFLGLVTAPSFAAGISGGKPSDSPTPNIMQDAAEFAGPDKQPMSMAEIQARSKGGLNEIQGTDDAEKMIDKSQPDKPDNVIARKLDKAMKQDSN